MLNLDFSDILRIQISTCLQSRLGLLGARYFIKVFAFLYIAGFIGLWNFDAEKPCDYAGV